MSAPPAALLVRLAIQQDLAAMRELMRGTPKSPAWSDTEWSTVEWANPAPTNPKQTSATHSLPGRHRLAWVILPPAETGQSAIPGKPLGFAVVTLLRSGAWAECELEYIATAQAALRRGIGSLLLGHVINWARDEAAHSLHLEVRASNHAALRLYERAGLRPSGFRHAYYRHPEEDAILMHIDLTTK